jgi:hypothetical protein
MFKKIPKFFLKNSMNSDDTLGGMHDEHTTINARNFLGIWRKIPPQLITA